MSDLIVILVEFGIFALVVGTTVVVSRRLQTAALTGRRLRGEAKREQSASPRASIMRDRRVRNPLLAWVQSTTSLKDDADRSKLEKSLRDAGFESPSAPAIFFVVRFGLAIGLPFLFLIGQSLRSHPMTGLPLIFVALFLCGVSLILPQAVVDRIAQGRRDQLEREFPDALDLMVVCVEAGLGIEAAFVRVGEEVAESHPRIAQEFEKVSQELRAGRTRAEALRNLGTRTGVDAVNSFATLLIQTDAL
ncbi:MAG: type II secretion system F family protein, partial [Ignavibacteriales bacterium]